MAKAAPWLRIGEADSADFWTFDGEVYRVSKPYVMDIWDRPNGARWECPYYHWQTYRQSAYGWVKDS